MFAGALSVDVKRFQIIFLCFSHVADLSSTHKLCTREHSRADLDRYCLTKWKGKYHCFLPLTFPQAALLCTSILGVKRCCGALRDMYNDWCEYNIVRQVIINMCYLVAQIMSYSRQRRHEKLAHPLLSWSSNAEKTIESGEEKRTTILLLLSIRLRLNANLQSEK